MAVALPASLRGASARRSPRAHGTRSSPVPERISRRSMRGTAVRRRWSVRRPATSTTATSKRTACRKGSRATTPSCVWCSARRSITAGLRGWRPIRNHAGVPFAQTAAMCGASPDRVDRARRVSPAWSSARSGGRQVVRPVRRAARPVRAIDDRHRRGIGGDGARSPRGGGARLRCAGVTDTRVATRKRDTSYQFPRWGVLSS